MLSRVAFSRSYMSGMFSLMLSRGSHKIAQILNNDPILNVIIPGACFSKRIFTLCKELQFLGRVFERCQVELPGTWHGYILLSSADSSWEDCRRWQISASTDLFSLHNLNAMLSLCCRCYCRCHSARRENLDRGKNRGACCQGKTARRH